MAYHTFTVGSEGVDCILCNLHVDDDSLPYPLVCGHGHSECSVPTDDGTSQAHRVVAAVNGAECYHCNTQYV